MSDYDELPFADAGDAMSDMHFDPSTHTYSVDGEIIPGVTSIMSILGLYDGVPSEVLERASERGLNVHWLTELLDTAAMPIEVAEEYEPYVAAWGQFRDDYGVTFHAIEERVYHPRYGYAGTIDRIATINDCVGVLDIKTTSRLHPETGVQLAAYAEAWNEERSIPFVTHRWAVQLKGDGSYEFKEYTREDDLATFLACLQIHLWKEGVKSQRKSSGRQITAYAQAEVLEWAMEKETAS